MQLPYVPGTHIIGFLAFGILIGAAGRSLGARQGRLPWSWTTSMLSGVAGALLGGLCGDVGGFYRDDAPAAFVFSLLGAFVMVGAYHFAASLRHRARVAGASRGR